MSEKNMGAGGEKARTFKLRELGPEAAAMNTLRRELKGKARMPKEEIKATKEAFGAMRERRKTREAGKSPEQVAAEAAGKERLREVIERGQVTESLVNRLAVHLGCEPWEALREVEKTPMHFSWIVDRVEQSREDRRKGLEELQRGDASDENIQRRIAVLTFGEILLENDLVSELGKVSPSEDVKWKSPVAEIPRLDSLERYAPKQFRTDYWTIGRLVAVQVPDESGFDNAKEADRLITAEVERVGRVIHKKVRLIDGAFYDGEKTQKAEQLAALDKKDAERVIAEVKKIREVARAREAEFKRRMRELLLELRDVNHRTPKQLPAVKSPNSVFTRFTRWVTGSKQPGPTFDEQERLDLRGERGRIMTALHLLNNERVHRGKGVPKYTSRFEDEPMGGAMYAYWDRKAEEAYEGLADEDVARAKLEEWKSK